MSRVHLNGTPGRPRGGCSVQLAGDSARIGCGTWSCRQVGSRGGGWCCGISTGRWLSDRAGGVGALSRCWTSSRRAMVSSRIRSVLTSGMDSLGTIPPWLIPSSRTQMFGGQVLVRCWVALSSATGSILRRPSASFSTFAPGTPMEHGAGPSVMAQSPRSDSYKRQVGSTSSCPTTCLSWRASSAASVWLRTSIPC